MLIGQLSKRAGLTRDTIRYYEKLGLLVSENRNAENDYKNYGRRALHRLEHIQQLKVLGFTLREIRGLLAGGGPMHPCRALPAQLAKKLEAIDKQVATLQQLKASLLVMRSACNESCATPNGMPACVPAAQPAKVASGCC
jgi:DNA-binding transcriptional MerR regulator